MLGISESGVLGAYLPKARMGATHFLTKFPKVSDEIALSVFPFDLTRVTNIVGTKPPIHAIAA